VRGSHPPRRRRSPPLQLLWRNGSHGRDRRRRRPVRLLRGIAQGQADDSILDKYDEIRRHLYKTVIDVVSSANFMRVSAADPDTAGETDPFLVLAGKANKDPEVKKEVDQGVYAICHDFTQYYHGHQDAVNGVALTT